MQFTKKFSEILVTLFPFNNNTLTLLEHEKSSSVNLLLLSSRVVKDSSCSNSLGILVSEFLLSSKTLKDLNTPIQSGIY